jgi:hypothetical protein
MKSTSRILQKEKRARLKNQKLPGVIRSVKGQRDEPTPSCSSRRCFAAASLLSSLLSLVDRASVLPGRREKCCEGKERGESRVACMYPAMADGRLLVIFTSPGELLWCCVVCVDQKGESRNVARDDHVRCGRCAVLRHKYVKYAKR